MSLEDIDNIDEDITPLESGHRSSHVLIARGLKSLKNLVTSNKAQAETQFVRKTYVKSATDNEVGTINMVQDSSTGYLIHMTIGENAGSNTAALAVGTDRGAATGLLISHKNSGRAMEVGVQPGAGIGVQIQGRSTNFPLRVMLSSGSAPVSLRASYGAGYADGVATTGSRTLTSATATFTSGDVGKALTQLTSRGATDPFGCIPMGTTITSVESATSVTMSQPAIATGTGVLFEVGSRSVAGTQNLLVVQDEDSATLTTLSKDGITAIGATVSSVPMRVRAKAGQTAPIFAVYDSSYGLLTYVGSKGHLLSGVTTALTSADISNGRFGMWLDATPGATKIKFAAKDSSGVFRTGELLLS